MTYSGLQLNEKVAVVIGGTSGIGLAIAKGMADAGADVIPTSRRPDQVDAAAKEIEARGRRTLSFRGFCGRAGCGSSFWSSRSCASVSFSTFTTT